MAYQDGFKQSFTGLDPLAALQEPITSLLGVSAEAAAALGTLGIVTVFDLAAAPVFQVAREIAEIAEGGGTSAMARLGIVPGGLLDAGQAIAPDALAAVPVAALNAVDDALASTLTAQLQVETIGELGRWAAFRAAQEVLAAATMPDSSQDGAEELVPRLGEFPTERRFYQSVIIDHVAAGKTTDLAAAGPIDIAPTIGAGFGFASPAVGARLTFAQSWFAHGVTLGNLLHSLALAAGESTRIALYDWSRQTSASATEDTTQAEQLTAATSHNRAVSEVQDAVAKEAQSGFSSTHAESSTSSGGGGFGLSLGPLTLGGTGSGSDTTSDAQSFSASTGSRSLAASMNQNVMDSTQQAASSVRNRRASIVKEVSEAEHEAASTRIVANYNHMHALTVQYFEVLELYRVSSHLHQVERCLFVPMKLVDFTDALVAHYRGVLADAALDQRAREMLTTEYGVVRVHPVLPMRLPIDVFGHLVALQKTAVSSTVVRSLASSASAVASSASGSPGATTVAADGGAPAISARASWSDEEMARAARIIAVGPARPGTSDLFLPDDAELAGVSFSGAAPDGSAVPISAVQVRLRTGEARDLVAAGPIDWSLATPVPLQDLVDVRVSSSADSRFEGQLTLQLSYRGARFPLTAPLAVAGQAVLTEVLTIGAPESGAELLDHLQQNQLHYSQAIWRAQSASNNALLLSPYSFESLPVADLIDPNPIMIAGNYLVFRMPGFTRTAGLAEPVDGASASDAEAAIRKSWEAWLAARGLVLGAEAAAEELVSVPTGGVFAEAVLGRSNSAELLDATRFWNWQDSPIPLQPPEIAAIQMESRAQPVDVTPGQLGAPVLNIMNPTTLPDPAGLAPMLAALQNGSMFRDMSGLAATVGLAQALGQATSTAATDAGKQAGANLAVAAQKDIAEKQIAAQLAMAAMGMPGAGAGTPKNISESGALLNTAKAMDAQAAKGQPTTGTSGPASMGGGTTHSGGSGGGGPLMPGVSGSLPPASSGSFQSDVMRRALGGIGADLIPAALSVGSGSGSGGAQATTLDVVPPFPEAGGYLAVLGTDVQLTNCAGAAESDPEVKDLCGAVVDVSGDPPVPVMYGLNSEDMLFVGSLAKLYALYVAFELRLRVEAQAKNMIAQGLSTSTAGWEQNVFTALGTAWQPQLMAKFPGLPPGFPQLGTIFSLSANGDVSFREHQPALTDADIDTIGENGSPDKLPHDGSLLFFRDWMRLMLRHSNNAAASRCILALSYPYINGALTDAGFFYPQLKAGLWLSGDYQTHDWLPANQAGQPLTPRWAAAQGEHKSNFTATAHQLARFMTLLARGRLIDSQSSQDMRSLLNADDGGIGSYVAEGLAGATPQRQYKTIRSKIGAHGGFSHDAAIVYVANPDPDLALTYISVALGSPDGTLANLRPELHKLVVKFHDCVIARHPGP